MSAAICYRCEVLARQPADVAGDRCDRCGLPVRRASEGYGAAEQRELAAMEAEERASRAATAAWAAAERKRRTE